MMRAAACVMLLLAVLSAGCGGGVFGGSPAARFDEGGYEDRAERLMADQSLSEEILGLDPERITREEVVGILSRGPAPRVILLNGSLPVVTMESVSRFLIRMGYPEESLRNPVDGSYTASSFQGSTRLSGNIAWYYERDGMMPILIGHSQGGMLALKVLHELDGGFGSLPSVWSPFSTRPEARYTITDPLSGDVIPVTDLKMGFVSAIATGHSLRVLLGQWDMLPRLRIVPDSVEEFAGYHIKNDVLGGGFLGGEGRYKPSGSAQVNNVYLPASYSHFTIPLIESLARDEQVRRLIDAYHPDEGAWAQGSAERERLLFAADLWYRIKKHWCVGVQRMIASRTAE